MIRVRRLRAQFSGLASELETPESWTGFNPVIYGEPAREGAYLQIQEIDRIYRMGRMDMVDVTAAG